MKNNSENIILENLGKNISKQLEKRKGIGHRKHSQKSYVTPTQNFLPIKQIFLNTCAAQWRWDFMNSYAYVRYWRYIPLFFSQPRNSPRLNTKQLHT